MVDYEISRFGALNLANAVFEASIRDGDLMKEEWNITQLWLSLADTTYDYYLSEFNKRTANTEYSFNKIPYNHRDLIKDYIKTDMKIKDLCKKHHVSTFDFYRIIERYHVPRRKYGGGHAKRK